VRSTILKSRQRFIQVAKQPLNRAQHDTQIASAIHPVAKQLLNRAQHDTQKTQRVFIKFELCSNYHL
jgi:hypothetical protein